MKKFLATLLVLVVCGVVAWLNWDRIAPAVGPVLGIAPAPATTAPAATGTGIPPEPRYRLALIDPTLSTDASFRESMKAEFVDAVATYVPAKPDDTRAGVPALTGLEMTIRLVGTHSLAYGQQNAAISIPSVAELPARPDMTADGALDPGGPYDTWTEAEAAWSSAYDAAVAAADRAVTTLQGLELDLDEQSGITAGAAALALLAPETGDVGFAVLSDLDDNQPTQPAAFHGHPLLVVQPDPLGDIGRWDALFASFSTWASAGGAGEITRVRPEAAASAIATFVTGK